MMSGTTLENEYCRLTIKEGIMYAEFNDIAVTLSEAKEIVEQRLAFQKQQNYNTIPLIIKVNLKYANKSARKYLGQEGVEGICASAFIAKTLAAKTLLKIFLLFEAPQVPFRVFEDEQNAVLWIKDYVEK